MRTRSIPDVGRGGRAVFAFTNPLPDTLVYLAAGSGITPIISHLKTLLATENSPKILLAFANRDSRHTIFKAQIDRWIEQIPIASIAGIL